MADTYTTIQGDTWDGIAYKLYGSADRMSELIHANAEHVGVVIFSADVLLQVPSIAPKTGTKLPPWKRGRSS